MAEFKIQIKADPQTVWDILWDKETYPLWTAPFGGGNHVKGGWEKGSKVYFLDAKDQGMVSQVADVIPGELMSLRYLGDFVEGRENLETEFAKKYGGSLENYYLSSSGGITTVTVSVDMIEEMREYFMNAWPAALKALKDLAEKV